MSQAISSVVPIVTDPQKKPSLLQTYFYRGREVYHLQPDESKVEGKTVLHSIEGKKPTWKETALKVMLALTVIVPLIAAMKLLVGAIQRKKKYTLINEKKTPQPTENPKPKETPKPGPTKPNTPPELPKLAELVQKWKEDKFPTLETEIVDFLKTNLQQKQGEETSFWSSGALSVRTKEDFTQLLNRIPDDWKQDRVETLFTTLQKTDGDSTEVQQAINDWKQTNWLSSPIGEMVKACKGIKDDQLVSTMQPFTQRIRSYFQNPPKGILNPQDEARFYDVLDRIATRVNALNRKDGAAEIVQTLQFFQSVSLNWQPQGKEVFADWALSHTKFFKFMLQEEDQSTPGKNFIDQLIKECSSDLSDKRIEKLANHCKTCEKNRAGNLYKSIFCHLNANSLNQLMVPIGDVGTEKKKAWRKTLDNFAINNHKDSEFISKFKAIDGKLEVKGDTLKLENNKNYYYYVYHTLLSTDALGENQLEVNALAEAWKPISGDNEHKMVFGIVLARHISQDTASGAAQWLIGKQADTTTPVTFVDNSVTKNSFNTAFLKAVLERQEASIISSVFQVYADKWNKNGPSSGRKLLQYLAPLIKNSQEAKTAFENTKTEKKEAFGIINK